MRTGASGRWRPKKGVRHEPLDARVYAYAARIRHCQ